MKKLICGMMVVLMAVLGNGCATTGGTGGVGGIDVSTADAEKFGRVVGVGYLVGKPHLSAKEVEILEYVYLQFDALITDENSNDVIKSLITNAVMTEFADDPESAILIAFGVETLNMYWMRLDERYQIDNIVGAERLAILRAFNKGIKEAVADYKFQAAPAPPEVILEVAPPVSVEPNPSSGANN